MRYHHRHFLCGGGEPILPGEITFIGEVFQITLLYSPRLFEKCYVLSESPRKLSFSIICTSIGFCKQANHIGVLNMLCFILNYIIKCNLQQNWWLYNKNRNLSSAFKKAENQWKQNSSAAQKFCRKFTEVLFLQYVSPLTIYKKIKISHM